MQRRRLAIAGGALLAALAGAIALWSARSKPAPAPPSAVLVVTVKLQDGSPAKDARVALARGQVRHEQRADAQGRARFAALPPGDYTLQVTRVGAARRAQPNTLKPGDNRVSVALAPAARLEGSVVDDAGAAVAGAQVSAQLDGAAATDPAFETRSDAQGHFALDELAAGRYALRVVADRHELAVMPALDAPTAEPVRVVLERTSLLHGRVLDAAGMPASGASVTIAGSGVWPPRALLTDADGRYRLEPVPSGVYELRARRESFVAEPREGVLVEPASATEIDLLLVPGAALQGRVFDAEHGTPLPNLTVTLLEDALSSAPFRAKTDAQGMFAFDGLRRAQHSVWIDAPGYVPIAGEPKQPGPDPLAFGLRRAAVLEGDVIDELDHPMAGVELEVTGTTTTGAPVRVLPPPPADGPRPAGALLLAPPAAGDNLGVLPGLVPKIPLFARPGGSSEALASPSGFVTDAAGSFRIEGVPAGRIEIVARHPGYAPSRSAARNVAAGAQATGMRVVLLRGGTLLGRVLDAGDQPAPNVLVQLELQGEPAPRATLSGADGRFQFDALRGRCTVTALPPGAPPVREQLELGSGEQREVTLVLAGAGRELLGRALDARGFPIESANIRVQSQSARFPVTRSAVSSADGTFRVTGLPAPPYVVDADHPSYAPTHLTQVATEPNAELKIELRAGARVFGLVLDRQRNAGLSGARVRLRRGKDQHATRTDALGHFEFRNITAGNYDVIVDADGFVPGRGAVAFESAEEREVDPITLGPAGSISGAVVDRLGAPVFDAEVTLDLPPDWRRAVRSDHGGHFVITGVEPGEHWVTARHAQAGASTQQPLVHVYPLQESPGLVVRLAGQGP